MLAGGSDRAAGSLSAHESGDSFFPGRRAARQVGPGHFPGNGRAIREQSAGNLWTQLQQLREPATSRRKKNGKH